MTSDHGAIRPGEIAIALPGTWDAEILFIGKIRTPWRERHECPRRGDPDGPVCRVVLDQIWWPALRGIEASAWLDVSYWMHLARRDLVAQNPKRRGDLFGTFALRSPNRPNPIAVSGVRVVGREQGTLLVRGLDCVDGTPLIDIKPCDCPNWHTAEPAQGGE